MQRIIPAMLISAALIHLVPLSGVLGASHLAHLYAIELADPNLLILMQHRAVLFGLVGLLLIAAARMPLYRPLAYIAGLVSAAAFVTLAWSVGNFNGAIAQVVKADMLVIGALLTALVLDHWPGHH